ncbi:MAG: hypothetical protein Q8L98_08280 [Chlamydiales bacterium]|nr:hypothetical protein [Chlamydiales bacterium]
MSANSNSINENLAFIALSQAQFPLTKFYEKRGITGVSELRNKCDDPTSFMNCESEALAKELCLIREDGIIPDSAKEIIEKSITKNVDGTYVLSIEKPYETNEDFKKINKIFNSLTDLFKSDRPLLAVLIYDLVNKCKDPSKQFSRTHQKALEEFRFINPDGSLDDILRKVVLTCVEPKGLGEFHLVKEDNFHRIVDYQLPSPKTMIHSFSSQSCATSIPTPENMTSSNSSIAMPSLPSPSPLSQQVNTSHSLSEQKTRELQTKFSALVKQWIDESPLQPKPIFYKILINQNSMIDIFGAQDQKIHDLVIQHLHEKNIDANLVTISVHVSPQIQINPPFENFIRFVESPMPSLPSPSPLSQRVNTSHSLSEQKTRELQTKFSALVKQWIDESPLQPKPIFYKILIDQNSMIDIFGAQDQKIHNLVIQHLHEKNIDANLVTISSHIPPQIQINPPFENFIRFVENPLQPF